MPRNTTRTRMDSDWTQPQPNPYHRRRPTRDWLFVKYVFTSLSAVFCVIVLGISIALAVDPAVQSYIAVWTAPQAGVALLWSAAELSTACSRSKRRPGIHPGAHVAVQLLLWLGFSVGVGLTAYILAFGLVFVNSDDRDAHPEFYDYYYNDDEGNGYEYYSKFYIRSMEALVAFLAFLIIIHFFLFVRAFVETVKRKKGSNSSAISVPSGQSEYPIQTVQQDHVSRKFEQENSV
ncbi:hypothetical protein F4677DRAFT_417030 [Hypoxylon crocopeplum]|nr:hypothetical protein F4677DRAFT_417030 [Hypoxylon crocopeplum]